MHTQLLSCVRLCDPIGCSPPGSTVHGISQARILEWVAISYFRGSSQPWDWTCISWVSCIGRWIFFVYCCASWEAPNTLLYSSLIPHPFQISLVRGDWPASGMNSSKPPCGPSWALCLVTGLSGEWCCSRWHMEHDRMTLLDCSPPGICPSHTSLTPTRTVGGNQAALLQGSPRGPTPFFLEGNK